MGAAPSADNAAQGQRAREQTHAKAPAEHQQAQVPFSQFRITRDLLEKLDNGWDAPSAAPSAPPLFPPPPAFARPLPAPPPSQDEEANAASFGAAHALHRETARLLRDEQSELGRVEERTRELLEREFTAPAREVPCATERRACVDCYRKHAGDTAVCAPAVDAYARCAADSLQRVWAEELSR